MKLRVSVKLPSSEVIRALGTRLGFGKQMPETPTAVAEPACPEPTDSEELPPPVSNLPQGPGWLTTRAPKAQESVALGMAIEPPAPQFEVGSLLAQLSSNAGSTSSYELLPLSPPAIPPRPKQGTLAIGFPTLQKNRLLQTLPAGSHLEFVTLETLPERIKDAANASLLLINVASITVVQRNRALLQQLIAQGPPTLLTGSRTALKQLGLQESPQQNWDFLPVPWDPSELLWRTRKLTDTPAQSPATPVTPKSATYKEVVVADHDPVTRTLVESTLAVPGSIGVHVTEDGAAALDRLRELRPAALIMDLTLANRDGFQLLSDIRRDPDLKNTAVVVLTARQAEVDILRAFGLGADDYVTKPFSPLELRARVQRLIKDKS